MNAKLKLFIIDGIFILLSIALLLSVGRFLWPANKVFHVSIDSYIFRGFFLRPFFAFVIAVAGLFFLRFLAGLLIKKLKPEDDKIVKNWEKMLFSIIICEVWGLGASALLFWANPLLGTRSEFNLIGKICLASYDFTVLIFLELFTPRTSSSLTLVSPSALAALPVQFTVYAIIGLIISLFLRRKAKSGETS